MLYPPLVGRGSVVGSGTSLPVSLVEELEHVWQEAGHRARTCTRGDSRSSRGV